jgi:hypothetical protein
MTKAATSRATVAASEGTVSPCTRSAVSRYAPGCTSYHVFGSGGRSTLSGIVSTSDAVSLPARRATGASGVGVFAEPASGAGSSQSELSVWLASGFQVRLSVE